jgi:hypothetical protein
LGQFWRVIPFFTEKVFVYLLGNTLKKFKNQQKQTANKNKTYALRA